MPTEYRVIWKREGARKPKRKEYRTIRGLERFLKLFSDAPWEACGNDPDELMCCSGYQCGCGGLTWREWHDGQTAALPNIEYMRIEEREVNEWTLTRTVPTRSMDDDG